MITRSSRQPLFESSSTAAGFRQNAMALDFQSDLPLSQAFTGTREGAWASGLFGFWCMNPYPAFNFGNNTAITVGNILTALSMVFLFGHSWRNKPYFLYAILMVPLWTATINCAMGGNGDAMMCVKVDIMRTIAYATLLTAQYVFPIYSLELLVGVAIACILHFIVGMCQLNSFATGEFPFAWLYNNKSFLSVQDMTKTIARYIQRPFGIFPEPSAMSSSLAPFVILWFGEMCGLVRFKRNPSNFQRILFSCGMLGSLMLIIISRSGHTAVTLLPIAIFSLLWLKNCKFTSKHITVLMLGLVVVSIVGYMGYEALSDRLGGKSEVGNSSWEERSSSLIAGYEMVESNGLSCMIFGIGPGNTSPLLRPMAQLEAVWSVILTYVYETGLVVGLGAVLWVAGYVINVWRKTKYNIVLGSIIWVWFIGTLLTTSYDQLQPIWLALGLMTVWRSVCVSSREEADAVLDLEQGRPMMKSNRRVYGN